MWGKALMFVSSLLNTMYQAFVPCLYPDLLPANTIDHQQYLGQWYFKTAVSFKEEHIQGFKEMDSAWFNIEEPVRDTLVLTGHMRIGEDCVNQTWIYHIHADRDDLELEGRKQRRSLLWSGVWANCADCIVMQEMEPPLQDTDTQDSLGRMLLYGRQSDMDSEMVSMFLKNAECRGWTVSVQLPQKKEFCP